MSMKIVIRRGLHRGGTARALGTKAALMGALGMLFVVFTASEAAAHVTIDGEGVQGGFATFSFNVPNERPDAATTELRVQVLADLPFVSVQPKPGWTAEVAMRTLDEPIEGEGEEITEVVDTITWTGGRIEPGQFDLFGVSAGPLPEEDSLLFPATQIYDSGEEVVWDEPPLASGDEPERPAPELVLAPPEEGDHVEGEEGEETTTSTAAEEGESDGEAAASETEDDDDSQGLAVAALVVGGLGLVVGIVAMAMARRAS
jgi:uncharacterized protein YcnI